MVTEIFPPAGNARLQLPTFLKLGWDICLDRLYHIANREAFRNFSVDALVQVAVTCKLAAWCLPARGFKNGRHKQIRGKPIQLVAFYIDADTFFDECFNLISHPLDQSLLISIFLLFNNILLYL